MSRTGEIAGLADAGLDSGRSRFTTDALVAYSEYFSEGSLDVSATQFARGSGRTIGSPLLPRAWTAPGGPCRRRTSASASS